jgi:heme O synthase-like polyprenyltransferase
LLLPVVLLPVAAEFARPAFAAVAAAMTTWLLWLAWRFRRDRSRSAARRLFFATLLYLPAILGLLLVLAR